MKKLFILSLLGALAFIPMLATPVTASSSIDISASNWKFTPGTITLHVGQTTTLHFVSKEGVHGVQSSDLGIPLTTLVPGKTFTVNVTPKKAGTYVLHCEVMCGPGHGDMTLVVKVVG